MYSFHCKYLSREKAKALLNQAYSIASPSLSLQHELQAGNLSLCSPGP